MAEAATLTIENVAQRLTDFGAMPADACAQVRELGWGISNSVFEVTWPDGFGGVKQALPKLRVAADWPFDMRRSLVERDCLILLGRLVPGSVPAVLGCDESTNTLAISCVPKGGALWKQALLAGEIEPAVAERAGELLGRIHSLAAPDEQAQARFQDQSGLIQGRTDP